MSDINIGEISEALNDKMDRDGENSQLPCAVVVRSQLPSVDNGYTWFRLYSDGWVEQGGYVRGVSGGVITKSLLIPMKDTRYTCLVAPVLWGNDSNSTVVIGVRAQRNDFTTSSIKIRVTYALNSSNGTSGWDADWHVEGMAA